MKLSRETLLAIAAGVLVLIVPPFLFPYPPFHDLVAFVGMQSYPPRMSYGPTHYYAFQLTYFLHHLISRLFTDFGIGTQGQARFYYLIHALGYFAVTAGLLNRFVRNPRFKAIAILAGALAFTDGMFSIGGPLPFSLAGVLIMISVLLISEAREADRAPNTAALLALAFLAMLSHPFSVPLLLVVCAANFAVTPRQRVASAVVTGFILVYALLIARDSPESVTSAQLRQLFDPNLPHAWHNLATALTWDSHYIYLLFREPLPVVTAYVNAIALVKLIGAALAVAAFRRLWREPRLRFLLLLEVVWVAGFATAVDLEMGYTVPQWPWRIWSIANPLLYSFPAIAAAELTGSFSWPKFPTLGRKGTYAALAGLAVLLFCVQYQLLEKGRNLQAAFQSVKSTVLQSGARDAVVTWADSANINPYFLRSAPYLLFSDPDMLARHLLFVTDWHVQPRHNSHIPEADFASARSRLRLAFLPSNGTIVAQVRGL